MSVCAETIYRACYGDSTLRKNLGLSRLGTWAEAAVGASHSQGCAILIVPRSVCAGLKSAQLAPSESSSQSAFRRFDVTPRSAPARIPRTVVELYGTSWEGDRGHLDRQYMRTSPLHIYRSYRSGDPAATRSPHAGMPDVVLFGIAPGTPESSTRSYLLALGQARRSCQDRSCAALTGG